jgi:hypothetical protein
MSLLLSVSEQQQQQQQLPKQTGTDLLAGQGRVAGGPEQQRQRQQRLRLQQRPFNM